VNRDQLRELVAPVRGQLLEPDGVLGVSPRAASLRQTRLGDVADKCVLELVFLLAA